jgi:hypothetical protein
MNIKSAISESISATSIIRMTLSGHPDRVYETILEAMDEAEETGLINYWDAAEQDNGSWDVFGIADNGDFRLCVTVK